MKRLLSKHSWQVIVLVGGLLIVLVLFVNDRAQAPSITYKSLILTKKTYRLEVVNTTAELEKGLSGRTSLPVDQCMLFVFKGPAPYGFWMKDMHFPIDIIWLNANKEVIYTKENLQPSTYPVIFKPTSPSLYTLECKAGFAAQNQLVEGQMLSF